MSVLEDEAANADHDASSRDREDHEVDANQKCHTQFNPIKLKPSVLACAAYPQLQTLRS